MANEMSSDVIIIAVDNMIYQALSEIRYSFSKRLLNFIKGFLDGKKLTKLFFEKD